MSTLSVTTIKSQTASTPPVIQDSAGTEVGTFCRAWVNFNGTGTVAIRAAFNVSSITDNGVGSYTVNFTNAIPDANYATNISVKSDSFIISTGVSIYTLNNVTAAAAGTLQFNCSGYTGSTNNSFAVDPSSVNVAIFR